MRFVVSSTELLRHLNAISRVISNKNTLPILDNFLFQLEGNTLTVTASDLETTLITTLSLENTEGDGNIAIPAKIVIDTLKEFPEQPLTFNINMDTMAVEILSENGKFSIVGQNGTDFPQLPELGDGATSLNMPHDVLLSGINKTLFATADDELRPVMNGIYIELSEDDLTFVASDAHKLVRYKRSDARADVQSSFILPKKPASLLKNLLPREDFDVKLAFDDKNAFFSLTGFKVVCRLVEGNYPAYNSVIPVNNPNKLTVDRVEFYNTLKRVSVFSNQASNLVKLALTSAEMVVSAQDVDFAISAVERIKCQYEGQEMEIGFKSTFLLEILSNLSSTEVQVELSDPTRAGILLPAEKEIEEEDVLMLLMPMMINA
ncbi:DNA polymerase III subunit beta [Prolixibacter bellariivorans]|uniref:Beta sliding clamp n=1 Tax=Prolixibacter bellariivorans TaxID=314319 RepID=A0A5M4B024_9BACT|nr:DNA polymerase III subunit beta [Prolixibacter bellariivorans]GET33318.1 DNA polymerase III subunit beta [Prolixibacter bellariivorans]